VLVGFRERHAPFITDMHRCEVLASPVDGLLDELSELIARLSIRARLPQIEIAIAENSTAMVFRVLDAPNAADKEHLIAFGAANNCRIYLQPGGLDSLELIEPAGEVESLYYTLPEFDIRIEFEPIDFVQVNREINQRMVHFAIEQLNLGPEDRVLDLYCGIGNFSLPLARKAGTVLGVEGEKSLVTRAADNAKRNGLNNVEFRVADLSKIDGTESWVKAGWDCLLLDPARSGAAEVVERMQLLNPERIVYVSCHPGTLARDAGVLVHEKGYRLETAGIIDMFPHTAHVESIAILSRT
jgi:23S rRNA (uracil1939-C5)-methyltransferase